MALDVTLTTLAEEVTRATHALFTYRTARTRAERAGSGTTFSEESGPSPYDHDRRIAGKSLLDALALELDSPLRQGLATHVYFHLLTRIGFELDDAIATERARAHRPLILETRSEIGLSDALRGMLGSDSLVRARAYFHAATFENDELISRLLRHRELLQEAAQRASQLSVDAVWLPVPSSEIHESAELFLRGTDDLFRAVVQEAQRAHETTGHDAALVCMMHASARKAREGWPATLSARWLYDVLPNLAFRRADPGGSHPRAKSELGLVPEVLGGASYARLLFHFGRGLRLTLPESPATYVTRGDPAEIDATAHGHLLAGLLTSGSFLTRVMGLGPRAKDTARIFFTSSFLQARRTAAKVLSGDASRTEELQVRALGGQAKGRLGEVILHHDALARAQYLALLVGYTSRATMSSLFDEDWFRNPRAREYFSAAPPLAELVLTPVADTARALCIEFERVLG